MPLAKTDLFWLAGPVTITNQTFKVIDMLQKIVISVYRNIGIINSVIRAEMIWFASTAASTTVSFHSSANWNVIYVAEILGTALSLYPNCGQSVKSCLLSMIMCLCYLYWSFLSWRRLWSKLWCVCVVLHISFFSQLLSTLVETFVCFCGPFPSYMHSSNCSWSLGFNAQPRGSRAPSPNTA